MVEEYLSEHDRSIEPQIEAAYNADYLSRIRKDWVTVTVEPGRVLGEGNFGVVFEAKVHFGPKILRFAIKRPKSIECSPSQFEQYYGIYEESEISERVKNDNAQTWVSREHTNYELAKKAGLKVFSYDENSLWRSWTRIDYDDRLQ